MRVGSNRAEMQLVPESLGLPMDPAPNQFGREALRGQGLLEATLAMQGPADAVEHFIEMLFALLLRSLNRKGWKWA